MNRGLVRQLFTADEHLSDVARARVWSRISDHVDTPVRRDRRWLIAPLAIAAAVALIVGLRRGGSDEVAVTVPTSSVMTTRLGPHAPATVVGPASLAVVGDGDATHVRLTSGAIYAEFEGGPGRSLRIDAPGATITIVGTRFAIETTGGGTCVSVSHGRVQVDAAGTTRFVDGGQRWCSGDDAPRAIDTGTKATIERYTTSQHVITAQAGSDAPAEAAPPAPPSEPARTEVIAPAKEMPAETPPSRDVVVASSRPTPRTPDDAPRATTNASMSEARPDVSRDATPRSTADGRDVAPPKSPEPVATQAPKPVATQANPTAEQRYEAAEQALARHDTGAADRMLAELVASDPDSPLASEALFDRARLAFERRAWSDARGHLDALAARHDAALAEPAHYLRCRVAVESGDDGAASCLQAYHSTYRRGPHDLDVLGLLAQIAAERGCAAARDAIAELGQAYPDSRLAKAWLARCPEKP